MNSTLYCKTLLISTVIKCADKRAKRTRQDRRRRWSSETRQKHRPMTMRHSVLQEKTGSAWHFWCTVIVMPQDLHSFTSLIWCSATCPSSPHFLYTWFEKLELIICQMQEHSSVCHTVGHLHLLAYDLWAIWALLSYLPFRTFKRIPWRGQRPAFFGYMSFPYSSWAESTLSEYFVVIGL